MDEVRKIKKMRSQIHELISDSEILKSEISQKQKELALKKNKIKEINESIDKIDGNKNIKVSEHAMLRYLERVKGMDLQEIQDTLINEQLKGLVETLGGTGKYPFGEFQIVMKNYTITTIV